MSFEPATEADIPTIMAIERTPGYENFIGVWTAEEHLARMRSDDARYIVWREGGEVLGFVIFLKLADPNNLAEARRIALAQTGTGLGGQFIPAMMDWLFENTPAHRLELECSVENPRALRVYKREGFVREGVKREVYLMPDGGYVSLAMFSILRREWEARRARA
jgi:diamine N-acetyltransferase